MNELVEQVLAENVFAEIAESFLSSGEQWTYVDRHVLDIPLATDPPVTEVVAAACAAAVALARHWIKDIDTYRRPDLLISHPYVVIDDEWLDRLPNSPPPHVYVRLARTRDSLTQRQHEPSDRRERSCHPEVDSQLTGREKLYRIASKAEGEPGCWILVPLDEPSRIDLDLPY